MAKIKGILIDCLLIVPYTAIWMIALLVATVIMTWQWIKNVYQKIEKRRRRNGQR